METGIAVMVGLMAIIFTLVGIHIEKARVKRRDDKDVQGVLNVICGDPESPPQLFLQLIVPVEDVMSKKQTVFDVHIIKQISQK